VISLRFRVYMCFIVVYIMFLITVENETVLARCFCFVLFFRQRRGGVLSIDTVRFDQTCLKNKKPDPRYFATNAMLETPEIASSRGRKRQSDFIQFSNKKKKTNTVATVYRRFIERVFLKTKFSFSNKTCRVFAVLYGVNRAPSKLGTLNISKCSRPTTARYSRSPSVF